MTTMNSMTKAAKTPVHLDTSRLVKIWSRCCIVEEQRVGESS